MLIQHDLGFHIVDLGERLNGIQEVSGSIPLISTRTEKSLGTSASKAFLMTYLLLSYLGL